MRFYSSWRLPAALPPCTEIRDSASVHLTGAPCGAVRSVSSV